jgi:hypothetical protein
MTLARSSRVVTTLAVLTCLAVAGLVGAQAGAAKTTACSVPDYPNADPGGYFTSLQVTGASCKTGRSLAVRYYKCRIKHGRKGRCASRVLGYSCKESRPADSQSDEQLNAKVTCRRGSRKIVHTYQQNLR